MTERQSRRVTARRFASNAEADRHDAEYWRQIPPHERVLQAWRLSVEQWQLLEPQSNCDELQVNHIGRDAFIPVK